MPNVSGNPACSGNSGAIHDAAPGQVRTARAFSHPAAQDPDFIGTGKLRNHSESWRGSNALPPTSYELTMIMARWRGDCRNIPMIELSRSRFYRRIPGRKKAIPGGSHTLFLRAHQIRKPSSGFRQAAQAG